MQMSLKMISARDTASFDTLDKRTLRKQIDDDQRRKYKQTAGIPDSGFVSGLSRIIGIQRRRDTDYIRKQPVLCFVCEEQARIELIRPLP